MLQLLHLSQRSCISWQGPYLAMKEHELKWISKHLLGQLGISLSLQTAWQLWPLFTVWLLLYCTQDYLKFKTDLMWFKLTTLCCHFYVAFHSHGFSDKFRFITSTPNSVTLVSFLPLCRCQVLTQWYNIPEQQSCDPGGNRRERYPALLDRPTCLLSTTLY